MGLIAIAIAILAVGWTPFKTFSDNPTKRKLAAKGLEPERQLREVFVLGIFFLSFFQIGVRGRHLSGGGRM